MKSISIQDDLNNCPLEGYQYENVFSLKIPSVAS